MSMINFLVVWFTKNSGSSFYFSIKVNSVRRRFIIFQILIWVDVKLNEFSENSSVKLGFQILSMLLLLIQEHIFNHKVIVNVLRVLFPTEKFYHQVCYLISLIINWLNLGTNRSFVRIFFMFFLLLCSF